MNAAKAPFVTKLHDVFVREVKAGDLLRALAVISPLAAAYFLSGDPALLSLGLIAISLLIPALKLQLTGKMVVFQFLAILITFVALFLAAPVKPLFVMLTALTGFLAVAVTRYGDALRTMGNWVFIPAVYLACEVREQVSPAEAWRHASVVVALSPIALALVCAVQIYDRRNRPAASPATYGPASHDWLLPASATAIAVFAAAALVEVLNLAQGQWVMWSAASVVVGDLTASTGKLKLRATGAIVGVPLGLLVGLALPASRVGYSFAVLATTLTLIAFSRYVVGFGSRCFFITLAAAFAGGASGIAEERVANVLTGGTFGVIAVVLTEVVWRRFAQKAGGQSGLPS
ncbi:FUSC family protein [Labrys okinawensis]|uniref:FUSC family protein n=1 Tax=Labrys okinawensis TaxID=346911 RepID=UPI0039BCDF5E